MAQLQVRSIDCRNSARRTADIEFPNASGAQQFAQDEIHGVRLQQRDADDQHRQTEDGVLIQYTHGKPVRLAVEATNLAAQNSRDRRLQFPAFVPT